MYWAIEKDFKRKLQVTYEQGRKEGRKLILLDLGYLNQIIITLFTLLLLLLMLLFENLWFLC